MTRFVLCMALCGCGTAPTEWVEHPCGNGDPVSIDCADGADYLWEEPSTDLCEDLGVSAGDACEDAADQCVLTRAFTCTSMDDGPRSSEAFLHCRDEPFGEEQCPQSSRTAKQDIQYVQPDERKKLADQVLAVKLARYRYADPAKSGQKLGYILEDHPDATFSGEGRVDLYAYVSAVVALAQEQQAEIRRLRAEVEALKAER